MPKWVNEIMHYVIVGGAGILGRLMFHAKQVQAGVRKPLSWVLLWDLPIALGSGWIAYGIAVYFKAPWEATISLSIVCSYLGPYGIDTIFDKWASLKFGKKTDANT